MRVKTRRRAKAPNIKRQEKLLAALRRHVGAAIIQGKVAFVDQGAELRYTPTAYMPGDLDTLFRQGKIEKRALTAANREGYQDEVEIFAAMT